MATSPSFPSPAEKAEEIWFCFPENKTLRALVNKKASQKQSDKVGGNGPKANGSEWKARRPEGKPQPNPSEVR